jgi:hypothetical protein
MESLSSLAKELHDHKHARFIWSLPRTPAEPLRVPEPKTKAPLPPPVGKGGELWMKLKSQAEALKHPNPEGFADAALRTREKTLAINDKKHKTKMLADPPKMTEVGKEPKAKLEGKICRARTLEGRPCRFKATCGDFCKKHAPK